MCQCALYARFFGGINLAIIKCKMCGGDLNIVEGNSVCECEYCGTKQTVPNADNEKKISLFMRAGRLLRSCEFDKAAGVFETIVTDYPEEAEAYWGLVLCKYGIEYVDDPGTGKKIPTCHRSSFESVEDDTNFEQACENADAIARRLYREEARQIEELRKCIIEVSGREDPYDIFISYKETDENGDRTLDSVIAQDIYNELTEKGYRVFFSRISLESKLGTEYEPYIFAALNSAKVMIVVGTDYENFDAVWVKNEWSRFLKLIASGQKKTLIPVFKNMDACDMPKEFAKLSAQDMGKVGAMQDLLRGVEKLIPIKKQENATVAKTVIQSEGSMKTNDAIKRGQLALEDREWEKAKQYFDQALTLDAECAEAYFGIALAELRARDPESFIRTATSQIPKTERLSIPENSAHIQKATEENAVTSFLKESEIKELYRYDLVYTSTLKGQQEIQNQVRQQIENNRSLSRALRFAAGDEKTGKFKDVADDAFEIHGGLVLGVGSLECRHFLFAEPVALALLHLGLQLCIELSVVDGRFVVYELSLGNLNAEEASAAGGVVQGVAVVGGAHEAGVAPAVLLSVTVDGSAVDATLGEELLELCLLAASHLIQLVDVHEQVVGQRHLLVELVGEVHVVEEVHAQLLGQQQPAESGLAASLPSDEGGHHLVAVEAVLLHPVSHHASQPEVHPVALLGAQARQAVEECVDVVLAVPLRALAEPAGDGIVVGDQAGLDDGLHLVADALAVGQRFLGGEDEAVQILHGEDPEFLLGLLLVSTTCA